MSRQNALSFFVCFLLIGCMRADVLQLPLPIPFWFVKDDMSSWCVTCDRRQRHLFWVAFRRCGLSLLHSSLFILAKRWLRLGGLPFPFSSLFWTEKAWRVAVFFPFRLGRHHVGYFQFEIWIQIVPLAALCFSGFPPRLVITIWRRLIFSWSFRSSLPWSPCAALWARGAFLICSFFRLGWWAAFGFFFLGWAPHFLFWAGPYLG